jgi:hypothetical protein
MERPVGPLNGDHAAAVEIWMALQAVEPPPARLAFDAKDFALDLVAVAGAVDQEREPLLHHPIPPAAGGSYGGRGFVSSHA